MCASIVSVLGTIKCYYISFIDIFSDFNRRGHPCPMDTFSSLIMLSRHLDVLYARIRHIEIAFLIRADRYFYKQV